MYLYVISPNLCFLTHKIETFITVKVITIEFLPIVVVFKLFVSDCGNQFTSELLKYVWGPRSWHNFIFDYTTQSNSLIKNYWTLRFQYAFDLSWNNHNIFNSTLKKLQNLVKTDLKLLKWFGAKYWNFRANQYQFRKFKNSELNKMKKMTKLKKIALQQF